MIRTQEGLTCLTCRLSGALGSGCDKTDGEESVSHGHHRKCVTSDLRINGRDFTTSFPADHRWSAFVNSGPRAKKAPRTRRVATGSGTACARGRAAAAPCRTEPRALQGTAAAGAERCRRAGSCNKLLRIKTPGDSSKQSKDRYCTGQHGKQE